MSRLEVRSAEINVAFSEVYDAAPTLPRPIKSKFDIRHISLAGLLSDAVAVAPLNEVEEAALEEGGLEEVRSLDTDGSTTRYVKRNTIYLRKATEFQLVHAEIADWYEAFLSRVGFLQTSISAVISVILLFNFKFFFMDYAIGFMTLALGIFKSWIAIRGYENLAARHRVAARGFERVKQDITNLLVILADQARDEVKKTVGHTSEDYHAEAKQKSRSTIIQEARRAIALAGKARTNILDHKSSSLVLADATAEAETEAREMVAAAEAEARSEEVVLDVDGSHRCSVGPLVRRVRRFYREAAEYRIAYTIREDHICDADNLFNLIHVVISALTSTTLFLRDMLPYAHTVSTALSVSLTCLNTVMARLKLPTLAAEHLHGRLAYASIQRRLETALMIDEPCELRAVFEELSFRWSETKQNCKPFKDPFLQGLRNRDRSLMLPLITSPVEPRGVLFSVLGFIPGGNRVIYALQQAEAKKKQAKAAANKARAAAENARAIVEAKEAESQKALEKARSTALQGLASTKGVVEDARAFVTATETNAQRTCKDAGALVSEFRSDAHGLVGEAHGVMEETQVIARESAQKTQTTAQSAAQEARAAVPNMAPHTQASVENNARRFAQEAGIDSDKIMASKDAEIERDEDYVV